jgi:2'-hydroxyisoflavone reductase
MRILILGGTIFLGRHLVDAAVDRGHEVTLFNRGQHGPDLFPGIEKLRGDRDGNLTALEGRHWDAVIDTCGYVPRLVQASTDLLADNVKHYTFISSISVYADNSLPGITEASAVGTLADESVEEIDGETYGPLKALCEQAAEAAMPGRVLYVRAGLIFGPYDPTDRFTYWPERIARGGEVLAPGDPEQLVQFVDARDLSAWAISSIEANVTGIFNVTGPASPLSMGDFLQTCADATDSDAAFTWADELFLITNNVGPFGEMPLWVPTEHAGMMQADCSKALDSELAFRPLAETIVDTQAWQVTRDDQYEWRAGLSSQREIDLLEQWHRSG